jgi:hypothetical protein
MVEKPQRRLEIINRRISRNDDRVPLLRRVLQGRETQRPRLDRRPGDIDTPISTRLPIALNALVRANSERMRAVRVGDGGMGGDSKLARCRRAQAQLHAMTFGMAIDSACLLRLPPPND